MEIANIVENQRKYFESGATLPVATRLEYLRKLQSKIIELETEIELALYADLGKSACESFMCELGMCLSELSYVIKNTRKWARLKRVPTALVQFHARSYTAQNPYGVALIMSPWNYPFMLTIEPLIGAISAGNCCIVKPSAYSPQTSLVIKRIIEEIFPSEYVSVITGGRAENEVLLEQKFDYIFFTGGVSVGKMVMEKAAQNLTPVTLELGGKSPCIVDETADIKTAARRIVFGKFLNCGQTCVAPDYILVQNSVKSALITAMKKEITKMYGENAINNANYGKIINHKHFTRLQGLMDSEKIIFGGDTSAEKLKIAPTIMDNVSTSDPIMQEEIFGPILPIISYEDFSNAVEIIRGYAQPLACYLFSNDSERQKFYRENLSFGGGCINDCIVHLASSDMPFGGVGASGMGSYHGKYSFQTFSHEKSILQRYNWIDLPIRYQPFKHFDMKLLKIFLK